MKEQTTHRVWFSYITTRFRPIQLGVRTILIPTLRQWALQEESRLFLMIPVLLGVGIGLYFNLKTEPSLMISIMGLGVIALIWKGVLAYLGGIRLWALALMLVLCGFCVAKVQTDLMGTKTLSKEIEFAEVEGMVLSVQHRATGWRIILKPDKIERLDVDHYPQKIRLTWRGKDFTAKAGDHINITASLSPLPAPIMPGGYDFGRHLYFQKIGAVGFIVSSAKIIERDEALPPLQKVYRFTTLKVERIRTYLFQRIVAKAPDRGGAIVAAIVTGKREAITPISETILRDSGLAHLLAISGLHMGLATGLIFFCVRFLLSLKSSFALHYPIKKWAAWMALASGGLYLIISGSGWSARRAFIMTAIIFIAILTDRRALSLRNVAVAATIILLLTPQALLHPGFQMSFAAVTALIAAYEWASLRYMGQHNSLSETKVRAGVQTANGFNQWGSKLRKYAVGVGVTDSVAAAATAPFALYHFHRTALYGLPANIVAMPLMGLWIMPAIIIALLMMPFGLDGLFWNIAAAGIEVILNVGGRVSSLPGAISIISAQSIAWLIILCVGGLILCLLKAPWRLSGLIAVPIAFVVTMVSPQPSIIISERGNNAGIHMEIEGKQQLLVYDRRRDRFAASVWMENFGFDNEQEKTMRMSDYVPCDHQGCVIRFDPLTDRLGEKTIEQGFVKIAFSNEPTGLAQDCAHADLVIALYPVERQSYAACKATLLDRRGAWEEGARAVWIKKNGDIFVRSVDEDRGNRPWSSKKSL